MAASLCGPVSQLLQRMPSACCKYSFQPRASRGHFRPRLRRVLPTPCTRPSTEANSHCTHGEGGAHAGAWLVSPGWPAGYGRVGSRARLDKTTFGYCGAARAALVPDSEGENNQRYCSCALMENNPLTSLSLLKPLVRYLHLTPPSREPGPSQAVFSLWFSRSGCV